MAEVLTIIAIVAVVTLINLLFNKMRQAQKFKGSDELPKGKENVQKTKFLADNVLKGLNCQPKWENEKDRWTAEFSYQNGHFRLFVEESSPFVNLYYLYFYTTTSDNLNLVRSLCNQTNFHTEQTKVTYTMDEEKNEINLHFLTDMYLEKDSAKAMLLKGMNDSFQWQTAFVRKFEEQLKEMKDAKEDDLELAQKEFSRELFLLRQQEMERQQAGEIRTNMTDRLALGDLLDKALGLIDIEVKELKVYRGNECMELDEGLMTDIRSVVCPDSDTAYDYVTISLKYTDPAIPDKLRWITVNIAKEGDDKLTVWFRATISMMPVDVDKEGTVERERIISVVFAVDRTTDSQRLAEFKFMWLDAQDKLKEGKQNELTEEQQLICHIKQPKLVEKLYLGKKHFLAHRYHEALLLLENAYWEMQSLYDNAPDQFKEAMFETCYLVGFCYTELKQYTRANFYLQVVDALKRVKYSEEYINALVNSGDFRSMGIVDSIMNHINEQHKQDEEEDIPAHVQQFLDFLKRRRAYLYVEKRQFEEAKKMLNAMLDDPGNRDFAINELAFIQKLEKGE